jgi:hypothetical protein
MRRIGDVFTFYGHEIGWYRPGINNIDTSRRTVFPMSNLSVDIPYSRLVEFDSTLAFVNRKIIISNHGWEIIIVYDDNMLQVQSCISTDIPAMRAKFTYILYSYYSRSSFSSYYSRAHVSFSTYWS